MVHGLAEPTRQVLMEEVLCVAPSASEPRVFHELPRIPWSQLRDDPSQRKWGWNFVQDIRNPWPVDGAQWLFNLLMAARPDTYIQSPPPNPPDAGRTDVVWNQDGVRAWLAQVQKFREHLLPLIHITGGQPARGPEVLSVRHTNTIQGEHRNVFVEDGMVVMVTWYHKGYNLEIMEAR